MKKKLVFFSVLLILSSVFTSCLSIVKTVDYKERAKEGSPEDSVIFYGSYKNNEHMIYAQSDTSLSADVQSLVGEYVVSAPVTPGSRYRLMYMKGSKKSGRYYTIWDSWFSMQTSGFDVQVPNEPGLYYIGSWDGLQSFKDAENKKAEFTLFKKSEEAEELQCLKAAKKIYARTKWEAVIQDRINELKK